MRQVEKVRIYNFLYPVGVPIKGRTGKRRTIVGVAHTFATPGAVDVNYRRDGEERVRTCWCNTWVDWADAAVREPAAS